MEHDRAQPLPRGDGGARSTPAALARELGDTALVVLNGPRHWLIDAASGETGGVRTFHGERLRRVATIPIRTAAELARAPYTDRTIARATAGAGSAGARVFELVAPGGDVYVMQSYSQIVDPSQRSRDLRRLGRAAELPAGLAVPRRGGCEAD